MQTLQEIGTMLRRGLFPYLFVLNNDGYEIERQIHGVTAEYNNIQPYDHQALLPFLAGKKSKVSAAIWRPHSVMECKLILQTPHQSYEVHTPSELNALLDDPDFQKPDRLRLIEVYMPRGDAPAALVKQAKLTAEANAKV
jgi:pyruvate decarboxylase